MSPSYSYQTLVQINQIRLLQIYPSPSDSEVRYALITHSLDSGDRYEAISYTWGSPDFTASITCDEKTLALTPSCATMLRYLRDPSRTRLVWIDQLCINQNNVKERNHQVTLMTQIYSKAEQVIVWIGESDPKSYQCLELLGKFSMERAGMALAAHRYQLWEQDDPIGEEFTPPEAQTSEYEDVNPWIDEAGWARKELQDILSRPYFLRVWILQEVSVARKVVLASGERKFDMQNLFDAVLFLQGLTPGDMLYPWTTAVLLDLFRKDYKKTGTLTMIEALSRTTQHQATNARDKVYALLGICNQLRNNMNLPDYDKSVEEVFMDAAKACLIVDGGRLSILSYATARRQEMVNLPSWCPDFGGARLKSTSAGHSKDLWEKMQNKHKPNIDGKRLLLRGKIVDTISSITEESDWKSVAPNLVQEFRTWKEWYRLFRTAKNSYSDEEPMHWAFWRTLFIDSEDWLTPHSARINTEAAIYTNYVEALHERFLRNDTAEPEQIIGLPQWFGSLKNVEDAKKYTRNKKACVTKNSYFGLVLPQARVGDVLAYLSGASTLYLLRLVKKNTYIVIGPCYVHGLMKGEKYPRYSIGLSKLTLV